MTPPRARPFRPPAPVGLAVCTPTNAAHDVAYGHWPTRAVIVACLCRPGAARADLRWSRVAARRPAAGAGPAEPPQSPPTARMCYPGLRVQRGGSRRSRSIGRRLAARWGTCRRARGNRMHTQRGRPPMKVAGLVNRDLDNQLFSPLTWPRPCTGQASVQTLLPAVRRSSSIRPPEALRQYATFPWRLERNFRPHDLRR